MTLNHCSFSEDTEEVKEGGHTAERDIEIFNNVLFLLAL